MILQCRTTVLRPLDLADAEMTLRWRLSARARFLQQGARTVDEQRAWIGSAITRRSEMNFVIEHQSIPVGMIALLDINSTHRTGSMGRLLLGEEEKTRQTSVAFEAELLLCDYLFDELGFHKLYGDVMEDNVKMLRTRRYLGYKEDGILRDHYLYDGRYKNTVALSLLEDEYRAICRPRLLQLANLLGSYSGLSELR